MVELKAQIETSANKLKDAWTMVQAASGTGTALPRECYEHWAEKTGLHSILATTADILPAREQAWKIVKEVASSSELDDTEPNIIRYGPLKMDFVIARHLALTSYVAVTWSIYDRLANICGRLSAIAKTAENPKQNPKLWEDFLDKKDSFSFGAHLHLQQAYAWPIRVSYKVRNWLVHEGYEEGSIPMFSGKRIVDGFKLHEDAVSHLEKYCKYKNHNGKIEACCLGVSDECWPTKDLLVILEKYHAEIDLMFSGLVKWCVDSFVGQITAFSERDNAKLISATPRVRKV
ncbi:MAG: hypothetical protein HY580_02165 [Nitrospinae bacterium]|nr:hypothetical protein [Nitrospinota bacterium]